MNNTQSHKVFLIGGYDLEMISIIHILEKRRDCVVWDNHLRWDNAFLSSYQQTLLQYNDSPIYGIELREDIAVPFHYHRIDHHNGQNEELSSIEQVASILNVRLTRYEMLVAANDKGYIPAMLALSATEEEIQTIRLQDRRAQGVSEEDEMKAVWAINNNLTHCGQLIVVKSTTSSFSPICDRLYPYQSLLVYTDNEWMFYGEGKAELVEQLKTEIVSEIVFSGGGSNGYIGSVRGAYTKKDIQRIVEQIKKRYVHL